MAALSILERGTFGVTGCLPLGPKVVAYRRAPNYYVRVQCTCKKNISSNVYNAHKDIPMRSPLFLNGRNNTCAVRFAAPSDPGFQEADASVLEVNDTRITVDSHEDGKIYVTIEVTGKETQKTFDNILKRLASEAPPVPGFRRQKGGKTINVPRNILLQVLGPSRVRSFVIQEIISSTVAEYVKKEDLKAKKDFKTTQSAKELDAAFEPGKEFVFNATIELEEMEPETIELEEMKPETID